MFRLEKFLTESLNRTNQVLFLYGENISDVFYYDFYNGTISLRNSLFNYFYREIGCKTCICLDSNASIIPFNNHTVIELNNFIYNQSVIDENLLDSANLLPTAPIITNKSSGGVAIDLKAIKKKFSGPIEKKVAQIDQFLTYVKGKKFLLVEAFEWHSELFNFHLHNYSVIRFLNRWLTTTQKDLYIVLLLKEPDMLKSYYFNIEQSNFINIPWAKPAEFFDAFYRHIYLNHNFKINMEQLENLSVAFKTNNFKLKEATNIFTKELKEHLKKNDDITELYPNFNKYFSFPIEEKIDFDKDIILDKEIKERIKTEFYNFINNKPEAKKGIIFTGVSGTGKTLIAKAVANMGGFNFMSVKLSDLKQLYVGHSGAEVKKIFDKARALEPTIIFVDEIDAVFPKRASAEIDSFSKDITNEFITQVDGVDTGKQRIFIIGATNIPEVLDHAVISRFDMQTIPLPRKLEREKLFELNMPFLAQTNWGKVYKHKILDKTEGLSGRDIKEISNTVKTRINTVGEQSLNKDVFDIAMEMFKEKVISTNKDLFTYISYRNNKNSFETIIGYRGIKKEIKNAVNSILRASELRYFNIDAERGILIDGPPGNGKSFISECIAGEFKLDFIKVISKDISSKFYSEDSKKLANIFDASFKIARLSQNGCVLFFDEFDGIAAKSSNLNLRATMLDLIIKAREVPNLVLLAATNYKDLLDEATIRDGRFDKKITIDNPTREDIFDLLRSFLKEVDKITLKDKIDNQITYETYEKILIYFDKRKNDSSKSIAGIKTFVNNLKRQAYFNKKIDSKNKLIIDDDTVLNYLESLNF